MTIALIHPTASEMSPLNTVVPENISLMSFALDTYHLERSPLNAFTPPENITLMSMTSDTSPCEMSPLNSFVPENIALMSFALDTYHLDSG